MDDILNGRIREQEQLAFKQYPVQLFGQYIEMRWKCASHYMEKIFLY